jgi:hypothetical protein
MIKLDARLSGDLLAGLKKLQAQCGEAVLRAGGAAGAQLIRDGAIHNASRGDPKMDTGTLKQNIIVKRIEERSDSNQVQRYLVAIRKGQRGGGAFYGQWVEQGHNIVGKNPKSGKAAGWKAHRALARIEFGGRSVPAHPFIRPAWESLKHAAIELMLNRMKAKMSEMQQQQQGARA